MASGASSRLAKRAGAHHAADVGRHHHHIAAEPAVLDVAHHGGRAEQIVGGDVEEALDLPGVEIDRQHAVGAGAGDEVRDQLGGYRRTRTRLPVLPGIAEIGDHGGDALRRRAPQRVDHDQQLHQIVVRRIGRRLDDERVAAADVFENFDEDFEIGEAPDVAFGERFAEIGGDRRRQRAIRIARQNFHLALHSAAPRGLKRSAQRQQATRQSRGLRPAGYVCGAS